MEVVEGGVNWNAFACGFGIVASAMIPGMAFAIGEPTVIICASLIL